MAATITAAATAPAAKPTQPPGDTQSRTPWDRRPGEPANWHHRFQIYRALGPGRTLEAAFRQVAQAEHLAGSRPGAAWYDAARAWNWTDRAAAWDAEQRAALMAKEQERRFDAREKRLGMIDQILHAAVDVIVLADLPSLDTEQAREFLPLVRLLARDMLKAEHDELALPSQPGPGDPRSLQQGAAPFTADDLAAAARAVEEFEAALAAAGDAPGDPHNRTAPPAAGDSACSLLVVIGPDPQLRVDLAALRKVKRATGLQFHRLTDATAEALDAYLRRERAHGRPVRLLHMAVHADAAGVQLADRPVDGDWLSERLLGVQVLVLAGCHGDAVGDWLQVVPHVVTLSGDISHGDAATLTEGFWTAVAEGADPAAALARALDRCAPAVSEYVVRHW